MATSGTDTFNQNRNQIINRAARLVGAIASGETPSANITQDFADSLNAMVKGWQASGIHVWAEAEGIVFLQPNQQSYQLGSGSSDHATQTFAQITTTAQSNAGSTTLTVSSISGTANGYNIGAVLNNGTIQWTTVNGSPSGSTITLATTLTDSVAAGNFVFTYQTPILRPLRVISGRRFNYSSLIETPMNPPLSRLDYRDLPNKFTTGTPTQFFYDPQLGLGTIYVWPVLTAATDAVKFTWMRQLQDFNTAVNTPDFPQEWINALTYGLAYSMSPEFGVPTEQYNMIKEQALLWFDLVTGWDKEPESVNFQVDFARMGR